MCVGSVSVQRGDQDRLKANCPKCSDQYITSAFRVDGYECTAVWNEMEKNRRLECCTVGLLCKSLFSLWRNVSPFSLKIFLGFWGSIPYFITVEGLLCFCSFLLRLPPLLLLSGATSGVQILKVVVTTHAFIVRDQYTFDLHHFFVHVQVSELFVPSSRKKNFICICKCLAYCCFFFINLIAKFSKRMYFFNVK